jgi:hypothetical protein
MTQPRRWFQIHLSTAIVTMLLASGMLYLSVETGISYSHGRWVVLGWPCPALVWPAYDPLFEWSINWGYTGADILLLGVPLVLMTVVSEYFIRRSRMGALRERWFHIHSRTVIVLTLVSTVFVGANGICRWELIRPDSESDAPVSIEYAMRVKEEWSASNIVGYPSYLRIRRYGFPLLCWERYSRVYTEGGTWRPYGPSDLDGTWLLYDGGSAKAALNFGVWIAVLGIAIVGSEWFFRRKTWKSHGPGQNGRG